LGAFQAATKPRPLIREDYQSYTPPAWVTRTVERLLESLSDQHVAGLSAVVLTESAQIRKGKSRRIAGKKYDMKKCFSIFIQQHRFEELEQLCHLPGINVLRVKDMIVEYFTKLDKTRFEVWFPKLPLGVNQAPLKLALLSKAMDRDDPIGMILFHQRNTRPCDTSRGNLSL